MKRKIFVPIIIFLLTFFSGALICGAHEIEAENSVTEFIEILPPVARDEIEAPLREGNTSEILTPEYFISVLSRLFYEESTKVGSVFFTLFALVIFFSVATILKNGIANENMAKIIENALLLASSLILYSLLSSGLTRVYTYIEDVKNFQNSLVPIMTGIYLSGGNTSTAVSSSAGISATLVVLDNLCARALPMLIRLCFCLILVGSIGADVNYTLLCKTVKNVYLSILGFASMILCTAIAFSTALSSSADTVAARAIKYTIANSIPIVGSTVNSVYGTLSASLSLIKSTVGASSVVALLLITMPIVIYLLLIRFSLNLCANASELLGSAKIGKLYTDFRTVYDLALAAVVFCSLIFFIITSVFIKCTWAVM